MNQSIIIHVINIYIHHYYFLSPQAIIDGNVIIYYQTEDNDITNDINQKLILSLCFGLSESI